MNFLIEKDSPTPTLLVIAFLFLLIVGSGLGLAYAGGVFTGKSDVIANDRRITESSAKAITSTNAEGTPSQSMQIHPVVQDNGLTDGGKTAKDTHDRTQQEDYHQQQN